jgi:hypothetical protein
MLSYSTGGSKTRPVTLLILSSIILVWLLYYAALKGNFFGNVSNPFATQPYTMDVQFSEHDEFKYLNPEYDHLWEELLTENGGFFVPKDSQDRRLKRYGIGMFHQLHCLQMIRGALQAATASGENHASGKHAHGGGDSVDDHTLHCFDYLRQVSALEFRAV